MSLKDFKKQDQFYACTKHHNLSVPTLITTRVVTIQDTLTFNYNWFSAEAHIL